MSTEVFNSVAVLLGTAIAGFLATRLVLKHLRAPRAVWLFIAILWIVALGGILILDVNIPLAESHYSFGGAPAPVAVVTLAMFLRFAGLAVIVLAQPKLRSAFPR
jgi:MFS-type transporter involved in bile tolerance (Atg22 family)